MVGEHLFEFDCDLGDYVLGNVRQYLCGVAERPRPTAKLHPAELDVLDFPNWFARQLTGDFAALADRIWDGVFGQAPRLPLRDEELFALAGVADDVPMVLEKACVWEPFPALHLRYVECITEIRTELTWQTAEEWAEASASFSARLCAPSLSLAEGITVVHEWLWLVRRLRQAMGATLGPATPHAARPVSTSPESRSNRIDDSNSPQPVDQARDRRAAPTKVKPTNPGDAAVCGWKEAMAITGLKKSKLYDLFGRGVLRGYRDGTMIRFYHTGLNGYMKDRENTPAAAPPRPARRPRKAKATPPTRFKFL